MVHALIRIDETVLPISIDYLNVGKGARTISCGILDWVDSHFRVCMCAKQPRRI
jgi:hypothetical protein